MRIALAILLAGLLAWLVHGQRDDPALPEAPPVAAFVEQSGIDPTVSFEPLTEGGVQGGEATTLLPGTPAQILAAITNFAEAARRRSFANAIEVVRVEGDTTEVALTLKGRVGVNPTIHVAYTTTRPEPGVIEVHYRLTKKALGIAHYAGRYRIEPVAGHPPRSRFRSRLFLGSGISLMAIDHEDIEAGQRTDQAELRAWLHERLAPPTTK